MAPGQLVTLINLSCLQNILVRTGFRIPAKLKVGWDDALTRWQTISRCLGGHTLDRSLSRVYITRLSQHPQRRFGGHKALSATKHEVVGSIPGRGCVHFGSQFARPRRVTTCISHLTRNQSGHSVSTWQVHWHQRSCWPWSDCSTFENSIENMSVSWSNGNDYFRPPVDSVSFFYSWMKELSLFFFSIKRQSQRKKKQLTKKKGSRFALFSRASLLGV